MWVVVPVVILSLVSQLKAGIPINLPRTTTTTTEPPVTLSAEEIRLNNMCQKCSGDSCHTNYPSDCRQFLLCKRYLQTDFYNATRQNCSFGTFWSDEMNACGAPEQVNCPNDPCKLRGVTEYAHEHDFNCRSYWKCHPQKGYSMDTCCPPLHRYVAGQGCIRDDTCTSGCPTRADACSTNPEALTASYDDGNCRTYWDCRTGGSPHPVCCGIGRAYSPFTGACEPSGCNMDCPPPYRQNLCKLEPTRESFELQDRSCRTFMACGRNGENDKRSCCASGHAYIDQKCVPITPKEMLIRNCSDECPIGFAHDCPLKAVPGIPRAYLTANKQQQLCAPGSLYSAKDCTCGTVDKGAADNSCNKALKMTFNFKDIIRNGSESKANLIDYGTPQAGSMKNGFRAYRFDGTYFMKLKLTHQSMPKLYMEIVFRPAPLQYSETVLVSNCFTENHGQPTFDVVLEPPNRIVVRTYTANNPNVMLVTQMQESEWNRLQIMYDGTKLTAINDAPVRTQDTAPMIGNIPIADDSLTLCGCDNVRPNAHRGNFLGDVHYFGWAKCVNKDFRDEMFGSSFSAMSGGRR